MLTIFGVTMPAENLLQVTVSISYGSADYRLESSPSLTTGTWTAVLNASIDVPSNGTLTIDISHTITGRRFYRVFIPD